MSDGGGLQLWVTPSGGKLYNFAYRFVGKQRKLAIGPYPTISLKGARARREEAKRQLSVGLDPSQQKQLARIAKANEQANTFEIVANEFVAKKRDEGKAEATVSKTEWAARLKKEVAEDILPFWARHGLDRCQVLGLTATADGLLRPVAGSVAGGVGQIAGEGLRSRARL